MYKAYKDQIEKRLHSWRYTMIKHRDRLHKSFRDRPSLKPYFQKLFDDCYNMARRKAATETRLSVDVFPIASPFTPEEVLDIDYLPDD